MELTGILTQNYFDIPMYSIICFFSKSPNDDIFMFKSDGIARISFSGLQYFEKRKNNVKIIHYSKFEL